MDFIISFFIFSVVVIIFFHFVVNKSDESRNQQDALLVEARLISNSLMLPGYPVDWNSTTVERIGLTGGTSIINRTKLLAAANLSYSQVRRTFDVTHDFAVYFEDSSRTAVPVYGICNFGDPRINLSKTRAISYYHGSGATSVKPVLDSLKANTGIDYVEFCEDAACAPHNFLELNDLSILAQYDLVIIEDAALQSWMPNRLEEWVAAGNPVLLVEKFTAVGVDYFGMTSEGYAIAGGQRMNMTVTGDIPILDYPLESVLYFNTSYGRVTSADPGIMNATYADFTPMDEAIVTWNYTAGHPLFLATANIMAPPNITGIVAPQNFSVDLEQGIFQLANKDCKPLNLSGIQYENIVRISRFLLVKNHVVSAVILTWD